MVKHTYHCDLCGYGIDPDTAKGRGGVGIYWKSDYELELRAIREAEHHICGYCIIALQSALKGVTVRGQATKEL